MVKDSATRQQEAVALPQGAILRQRFSLSQHLSMRKSAHPGPDLQGRVFDRFKLQLRRGVFLLPLRGKHDGQRSRNQPKDDR